MKYIRIAGVGAVVAMGLTGLAGCGGSGGGSDAAGVHSSAATGKGEGAKTGGDFTQALALASSSTKTAKSARMHMVEKMGTTGTVDISGTVGWNPVRADMTVNTSGIKAAAGVPGAGQIKMRMTGTVMYMDIGDQLGAQLGGKHWMKLDLTDIAKDNDAAAPLAASLNKQSGSDPSQGLALLRQSGNIRMVGKETVNGVAATHYAGVLDIAKQAELAGGLDGMTAQQRQQFHDQMTQLGVKTMNMDLWVDGKNLPVRMHETSQTANGPLDIMVDYSDYGAPVDVSAPPAADTLDFADLLKAEQPGTSS